VLQVQILALQAEVREAGAERTRLLADLAVARADQTRLIAELEQARSQSAPPPAEPRRVDVAPPRPAALASAPPPPVVPAPIAARPVRTASPPAAVPVPSADVTVTRSSVPGETTIDLARRLGVDVGVLRRLNPRLAVVDPNAQLLDSVVVRVPVGR
jgi:hypothetical protein